MLVYDQPIGQAKAGVTQVTQRTPAGFSILELSRVLWQRKAAIAAAGLICACAAVAVGKSLTPKFSASAELYVDPRELQLVDRELTPRAQDLSGLAMVVESQARLITSNNVLLEVIQSTGIDKDPEFGGVSRGILATMLRLIGIHPRTADDTKLGQMAALDALNRHVTVKKTDRSFIVDVDVWSCDPAKAAMLANALAHAYLTESRNSQATAARRATKDLSGRLMELKERLRNAENALAIYKAQNNFVGTQDTLISDQQLSASNQRLAAARAAKLDAQAKYDQIESSRRAATDSGAIPEALQSPTIANLRAQYAEARKRYAELASELGPLHPSLRQMEKQVEDLRRTINEEVDRFATAAKNDLTRARDYEASLNKALDAQKRQSVEMSQAAVRLRELERDVDASRDVYQAFLKRSRETEEQESLNTSSARIIGEATVPQHRAFPPGMSVIAMIGFILGTLAAAAWAVITDRLPRDTAEAQRIRPDIKPPAPPPKQGPTAQPQGLVAIIDKPPIARLQESDVIRTLGGILTHSAIPDVTRIGWPTLRMGASPTTFLSAIREMRAALAKRSPRDPIPVMAVIGAGAAQDRGIAALNIALAAARDGMKVLMVDADHAAHELSNKVNRPAKTKASRLGWLNIGSTASRAIETTNGISVLPAIAGSDVKSSEAIRKAIAQARSAGGYDLVVLDGPVMPWSSADRKLLDEARGLVAVLPASLDINNSMETIIAALGGAEHRLVGVILNELQPAAARQQDKQYA
ncbi:MAG: hypothetical protein KGK01_02275 [Bradyrhizobium sp.]|uniref:exopolysaccharide transport family protein n=1 Tax=Bradyrhizobium sp. TaxID=376 RepID=UPI001C286688|nr:exopolysaccharide transport family protein [Bradyrhizobium sp.]MBU6461945.1 exopolysaccharide transport family protein [Pseudomonadota bacterium]MDE2066922.1 hypothetical protein [Bradyrhizobium sp.]MDE2241291.1 hypothetical protein [Bradyrhizobium sp.]